MSTDTNIDPTENPTLDDNEFDIDLGGIDTSIQIMEKDSKAELFIKSVKIKPNKAETGKNLIVFFSNSAPAMSTLGVTIPRGEALITKYYPLQPNPEKLDNPDYNPDRWKNDIADLIDACFGSDKSNRPRLNASTIAEMKDIVLLGKVEVEKPQEGTDFGPKNIVSGLKYLSA